MKRHNTVRFWNFRRMLGLQLPLSVEKWKSGKWWLIFCAIMTICGVISGLQ